MQAPKYGRQYRPTVTAANDTDADPLDTVIRSAETFFATLNHVAELHGVDTAQLRDQLCRELRPEQTVLLRHIHHGARALAESGLAIPRAQRGPARAVLEREATQQRAARKRRDPFAA